MDNQNPTSASAIIIKDDGKVFIARRGLDKKFSPGQWETMGGGIEQNETAEQALKREIKEELGVKIKSLKFFDNYDFMPGKVSAVYLVELDGDPQPNPRDFIEWGWYDKEEIMPLDFALDCKQRLLDYFKMNKS